SIEGAKGVLFNIAGSKSLTLTEINEASSIITQSADPDANIIFGTTIREDLGDDIQISVIAAGFDSIRHFNPASGGNSYFKPTSFETQPSPSVIPNVVEESQSTSSKSSPAGKYKLQHDEVDIEDDLDIPTFLRNKF
ncbi:MAG: Cell division protein FtsZ, partial [Candidatus Collierbacteria bacterium GW2011_GWC2_44_18]